MGGGVQEGKNGKGRWKKRKKRENEIQRSEIKERRKGGGERKVRIAKRRKRKEGRKEGRVGVKETKRKNGCKKGSQRVGQFSLKISRRRGVSWKRELER